MPSALKNSVPSRVVIKLGTGVLTRGPGQLDEPRIADLCAQIAALRGRNVEVLVVSSGAIGLGMGAIGLTKRPIELAKKQACAAIGQSLLMQTWQHGFAPLSLTVAQVLLTHEDLRSRDRYLGVKAALRQLIGYGAIPIINENDTVSAAEIKFGDNDLLSALVASLIEADHLVILSTAPGLIDLRGTKQIVSVVEKITPEIEAMAGGTKSETAVGGMVSKIAAAKLATKSGCGVFIADGAEPGILEKLFSGRGTGTFFVPSGLPLEAKKRWLAYFQRPTGTLRIDEGAVAALRDGGKSLLAAGLIDVNGDFASGDIVNIAEPNGDVIARGTSAFSSSTAATIAGKKADELRALFPGRKHLEVVHRDDLVLL
ncbi:MAG: glutamate 5-kinase [Verrucomicrobiota bacterium]|nr:glutamate 5-kinase [Verrucomicrobiota bacterium]